MSKLLSTTTCYDNDKYIAPTPEIKTNIQLTAIDQLKKYAGVPHGMSMVALTLIDPLNRNLEMNVVFESEMYLNAFADHVINIWEYYKPISSFIRSYKSNGEFLDKFNGYKLKKLTPFPFSIDHFNDKKVIIDVEAGVGYYLFKCYKWNEEKPRVLHLTLAPQQSLQEEQQQV